MEHVVIIGSSVTGMATAKIFSEYAKEVTIIEKNILPNQAIPRKGVPQGQHLHLVLSKAHDIINHYFPETPDIVKELGGKQVDLGNNMYWFQKGVWKKRHESGLISYNLSRPVIDTAILRQLRTIKNIEIIEGAVVEDLHYDKEENRITGLSFCHKETGKLHFLTADLVIDCSGRNSKTPEWLESLGIGRPELETVEVNLKYVTRYYKKPQGMTGNPGLAVFFDPPKSSQFSAMFTLQDMIMVTMGGMLGNYPGTTDEEYIEYASKLDNPAMYDVISKLEPIDKFRTFFFKASVWKQYHKMANFPKGMLILGDAYCSINPIYGQGITKAMSEVEIMDKIVQQYAEDLDKLQQVFFKKVPNVAKMAFAMATLEDFRFDEVKGKRPVGTKVLHKLNDAIARQSWNSYIYNKFLQVMNLKKPITSLLNPVFLGRLFLSSLKKPKFEQPDVDAIFNLSAQKLTVNEEVHVTPLVN